MLADLLPEQLPGDGVGPIRWSRYVADIHGSPHTAEGLMERVCGRITEVMPIEFAAEPGVPLCADEGTTLTAAIPGRGHIQVRVEQREPSSVTFATVEGHPLAGLVRLHSEKNGDGLRFSVQVAAQPANAMDWIAMRVLGDSMQSANWRAVVRRVVDLSEGIAPAGVQKESGTLSDNEASAVKDWAKRIVQRQQRVQKEMQIENPRVAAGRP